MKSFIFVLTCFLFILFSNQVSAAHFIVGVVNDSIDGTISDEKVITLFSAINQSNNITDIIGITGNSGASTFYMFDCELLTIPCEVGDVLSVKVFDNGAGYQTRAINVSVTGAGFDLVNDLVLNSPPKVSYIVVDDDIISPYGEIDLIAGGQRQINCIADIYDSENDSFYFIESRFFDNLVSNYNDLEDNNDNYKNDSCYVFFNSTTNHTYIDCGFSLEYYTNNNNWNCTLNITDSYNYSRFYSNNTFINKLLAFSVPSQIDYGTINANAVSDEVIFNVSNYGNSILNLSLYGYAITPGDNLSMNCSLGVTKNISLYYEKYNLTSSNVGSFNLAQFESNYKNLTSLPIVNRFNLFPRQDEFINEAVNSTYWRIYVPAGVAGTCSGNIVFGAVQSSGI